MSWPIMLYTYYIFYTIYISSCCVCWCLIIFSVFFLSQEALQTQHHSFCSQIKGQIVNKTQDAFRIFLVFLTRDFYSTHLSKKKGLLLVVTFLLSHLYTSFIALTKTDMGILSVFYRHCILKSYPKNAPLPYTYLCIPTNNGPRSSFTLNFCKSVNRHSFANDRKQF